MAKKLDRMTKIRNILSHKQAKKVDGFLVDITTANMLVYMFDNAKQEKTREIIATAPLDKVAEIGYKNLFGGAA